MWPDDDDTCEEAVSLTTEELAAAKKRLGWIYEIYDAEFERLVSDKVFRELLGE